MKPLLINLDLKTNNYSELELKQGCDDTVIATITDLGEVCDLTGQVVTVEMLKADKTFIIQNNDITVLNNKITIKLNKDFTRVFGKAKLQIKLTKATEIMGSWVVDCWVREGAINQAIGESGNIVTIIETLENNINLAVAENAKTENLILNGGAATKGELAETNSHLADINQQKIAKGQVAVSDINKNLGKLDQTFLSDNLLQQIAGTAPINAVPSKYSITRDKLAFNPLEGKLSKNLFNKNTAERGMYLRSDNGNTMVSADYFASDFIKVKPSTTYAIAPIHSMTRINFYTETFTFISGVLNTTTVTIPINAYYIRLASKLTMINTTQFEEGSAPTPYAEYGVFFDSSQVLDGAFNGNVFKDKTITKEKLSFIPLEGVMSKNLFDETKVSTNTYLRTDSGVALPYDGVFSSDFIPIEPNTEYNVNATGSQLTILFYTTEKGYTSVYTQTSLFTSPTNASFVRFYASNSNLGGIVQLEKGKYFTGYEQYGTKMVEEDVERLGIPKKRIYTFNDAWVNWMIGEKFPIAFFGDSTIDGVGTSGNIANILGTDDQSPNAFPYKLEQLLKSASNNQNLRIYNAGFAGRSIDWGLSNIESEFGSGTSYEDVKMIGIGFGINDRNRYENMAEYRNSFKNITKTVIKWCYKRNIQPFLITTQAILSPDIATSYLDGSYPMRTAMHIETIANEVKRELAIEEGLELIDVNKFTEMFLLYSNHSAKTIIEDRLHFGNIGHQYESELLFSHFAPYTIFADDYIKIDYSSQKLARGIPEDLLTIPDTLVDQFKVYANYTKADSTDTNIMTVYIFNSGKKQLTLKGYKSDISTLTYVKINGITKNLDAVEKTLEILDLGLYKIEVFSGISNKVDFKGFVIE